MATPPPDRTVLLQDEKSHLPIAVTEVSVDATTDRPKDSFANGGSSLPEKTSGPAVNEFAVTANKDISPGVNGRPTESHLPASNGITSEVAKETVVTASLNSQSLPSASTSAPVKLPSPSPSIPQSTEVTSDSLAPPLSKEESSAPGPQSETQAQEVAMTELKLEEASPTTRPDEPMSIDALTTDDPARAPEQAKSATPNPGAEVAQKPEAESNASHEDQRVSSEQPAKSTPQPSLDTAGAQSAQTVQQSTSPVDHEMTDAPGSPTKIVRERDTDMVDEPAAKRARTNGDGSDGEFKVPEVPTPTAPTHDQPSEGDSAITKYQWKFLTKCITSLKRMGDARFYKEPVDPVKLNIPNYPSVVTHPMDLSTIEKKLRANQYPTVDALVDDFNLMVQNAMKFNGPDHLVSQEGQRLKASFEKQLTNLPKADDVEEKKAPKKAASEIQRLPNARRESRVSTTAQPAPRQNATSPQATTFALGPEGLPLIRRDSTNADGRPKRSIHPPKRDLPYAPKPKKKKYQWELKFCQEVLDELHKPKHYNIAAPFYLPVDPVALNIPTYHNIIKKPMDLQTVAERLKSSQYENAKEFENDIRLIFKNCFKFNIPGDPTYIAGKKLEELFDSKWSQKAQWIESHDPQSGQQSGSSDEESEESADDSDEDADQEKLQLLQKQIAEMSRQVEAITAKKKKTPPTAKKSSKAKSSKKDSKKSSKKDKKSSGKSGKSEKQRWVTYQEKQIISDGISSLPDKKMQEALKIIQNNVPALKGTQETEIELDIDELPNDVLLMLLKFVKKNAPRGVIDEEDTISAPAAVTSKPKKNKPMSKYEQEAQINMLEGSLSRFQGTSARSPDAMPSIENNDDSSDDEDDDSEESEEE